MSIQIRRKHEKTPYLQMVIVADKLDTLWKQRGGRGQTPSAQILSELNCIHYHDVVDKNLCKEFYQLARKHDKK